MSRCHFHERAQTLPREEAAELELPRIDRGSDPLLRFDDLGKVFKQQGHDVHALVGRLGGRSGPARRSVSSVSRAAARRRLPVRCSGSSQPTSGAVVLDGRELGGTLAKRDERATCDRCRSSSRIRTRRSTGATRCAGSSAAR